MGKKLSLPWILWPRTLNPMTHVEAIIIAMGSLWSCTNNWCLTYCQEQEHSFTVRAA